VSAKLATLLKPQSFKGHRWLGSDLVQGDPRFDCALELLLKRGVPAANNLCAVHLGCGAWLNSANAKQILAIHPFAEEHDAFVCNSTSVSSQSLVASPFDALPQIAQYDTVILRIFRDMDLNWFWMDALLRQMAIGARLHVIGAKDDGIHSLEKRIASLGLAVEPEAVGCHSRWFSVERTATPLSFPLSDAQKKIQIATPQGKFELWIPEGVFSAGRLDSGTAILLENLGDVAGKSVWDLGCGAGIIARSALELGCAHVFASDHSALAFRATQLNLAAFADRAHAGLHFLGDGVEGSFDLILSNPPFHLESRELRNFGKVWLVACMEHLAPGGEIRLVCNGFLPYAQFAQDLGLQAETLVERAGFKVWKLSRLCRKG
jgi:16S rRNA (guanine1207-N2)-methyltransferase